jgi:hypothetical protein
MNSNTASTAGSSAPKTEQGNETGLSTDDQAFLSRESLRVMKNVNSLFSALSGNEEWQKQLKDPRAPNCPSQWDWAYTDNSGAQSKETIRDNMKAEATRFVLEMDSEKEKKNIVTKARELSKQSYCGHTY